MRLAVSLLPILGLGCSQSPVTDGVHAIVDISRPDHFFDHPFPADSLRDASGRVDLSGYPVTGLSMTLPVIEGWRDRAAEATHAFGNASSVYFRFDGPLDLPSATKGVPSDPVVLIDLDSAELIALDLRFTSEPLGDEFLASNLLALSPRIGHIPSSGARLAAVVMQSSGAVPPQTSESGVTEEVLAALDTLGIESEAAVATVFTTQAGTDQLRQLASAADSWSTTVDWSGVVFKRVVHIEYSQGETPSGSEATIFTARFEDGSEELTYIEALNEDDGNHELDLLSDWPLAVFQATLAVPNFSGLEDRPYMSPGLTHLFDTDRKSGWIEFEDGELVSVPDTDATRITVSIPLDESGEPLEEVPVIVYDHGTGGHAYNAVQRRNIHDDGLALATVIAEEGYAIIGRDAPLYGTRYPPIDEGYGGSLGFYNIVNTPAFRDNQRQTAIEGQVLLRFIEQQLNSSLPMGSVDTSRIRRMGHSLGSVTSNLGVAANPEAWESVFLSGTGGLFMEYFLETGLIQSFDPEVFESIFTLLGADTPDEITTRNVLGAALGLPSEAWPQLDRLHPLATLFQWMMDPSDPMTVARDEAAPVTVFVGIGDWQVPNFTSEALANALPDAKIIECTPSWEYDPHYCLHREPAGIDALRDWLQTSD